MDSERTPHERAMADAQAAFEQLARQTIRRPQTGVDVGGVEPHRVAREGERAADDLAPPVKK